MVGTFEGGVLLEFGEQAAAVARQQRQEAQRAFLQIMLRIERIVERAFVGVENAGAKILGASGFGAEIRVLVAHFVSGGFEGAPQSLVQFFERLLEILQQSVEGFFAGVKFARQGIGQRLLLHLLAQMLAAFPHVGDIEAVFFQKRSGLGVH